MKQEDAGSSARCRVHPIPELKKLTGMTRFAIIRRIELGCRTVDDILKFDDAVESRKIELLKKIFEKLRKRRNKRVHEDFPDCGMSGSSLRAQFNKYIPDLYRPGSYLI